MALRAYREKIAASVVAIVMIGMMECAVGRRIAAQRGKDARGNADQKRHDRRRDHQIKRGTERLKKDFLHRKTGGVASAHVKTERIEEIDPKLFPQRLI